VDLFVHNSAVNSIASCVDTSSSGAELRDVSLSIGTKLLDLPRNCQVSDTRRARILVVEDNAFVRESIVNLINGQPDLFCYGQADSVTSTPAAMAKCKPDLILMDLRFKDGEAFELISSLTRSESKPAILVLSRYDEILYAERALRAGARGYVMKAEAVEELLPAIRTVLGGCVYLSPAMSARLVQRVLRPRANEAERQK
jgi:DNA-binding NarL/FixJ family response regulator